MAYRFNTTIAVPSHAMGHIIGRFGETIRRIRSECGVVTYNEHYHPYQAEPVRFTIAGNSRNAIQQAIFQIDHQIAISKQWCRMNGIQC